MISTLGELSWIFKIDDHPYYRCLKCYWLCGGAFFFVECEFRFPCKDGCQKGNYPHQNWMCAKHNTSYFFVIPWIGFIITELNKELSNEDDINFTINHVYDPWHYIHK